MPSFPPEFVFGAATAAYQVEGGVAEDGRLPSIWDTFSHTPGRVFGGDTGDVACDHFHRWEQDLDLMADLGLEAYRFSVAWPRVVPTGTGEVNVAGLDFYDRLVNGLLERGIQPHATLYHWDLPQVLEDAGGWPERSTTDAFVDYALAVAGRLGDRLASIATLNEPWVVAVLGYEDGVFAPGRSTTQEGRDAAHHLLLAHGRAVTALREVTDTPLGIVLNFNPFHPASGDPLDVALAAAEDARYNRWFIEPLAGLGYPAEGLEGLDWSAECVVDGDFGEIAVPLDFIGVNYYTRTIARHPHATAVPTTFRSTRRTGFDWEIHPDGIAEVLRFVHSFGLADRLLVTENGAAFPRDPDDVTEDPGRIAYLADHLERVAAVRAEGVPVEGYFAWSLLDNFEWANGYSQRFGIVDVDFGTLARTPRRSARWYADLITSRTL